MTEDMKNILILVEEEVPGHHQDHTRNTDQGHQTGIDQGQSNHIHGTENILINIIGQGIPDQGLEKHSKNPQGQGQTQEIEKIKQEVR